MKLSILIPVYNEAATLDALLQRVLAVEIPDREIVVVDDHSTDASPAILENFKSDVVRVIRHEKNLGKGAAVRTALTHARGDYVIIQDADNELDPNDILRLLAPVRAGSAVVVYGARNLSVQSFGNRLGNQMLTLATNILFGTRISDMETCYKLMPTVVMRDLDLRANSFDIEPEITAKLARGGLKIFEVPVRYTPRTEHKKMRPLREGLRAILLLLRLRWRGEIN